LPNADVDVVTRAIGIDSRIGTKYFKGGLGFGGPCFPRDNVAFAQLALEHGARADLAQATHALNLHQVARLYELVSKLSPRNSTVAVLGMAYKPDTPVIEESQGVMIASMLAANGRNVVVYVPLALDNAMAVLGDFAKRVASAEDAVSVADVIVVATPCDEFKSIALEAFQRADTKKLLCIDCWRILPAAVCETADVIYLGVGPSALGSTATNPLRATIS
jgi:UDPglucose 6-dehydrogenase